MLSDNDETILKPETSVEASSDLPSETSFNNLPSETSFNNVIVLEVNNDL